MLTRGSRTAVASLAMLALLAFAGACSKDDPTSPRTGRLSGTLVDGFRTTLPHGVVHAWSIAAGLQTPSDSTSVQIRRVESDANGAFDFGELPAGAWAVAAVWSGELAAADTLTVPATGVRLELGPAGVLKGRVQLGALPGAGGVRVSSVIPTPSVLSSTDGRWVMSGLPAGHWPVRLSMDGFRDSVATVGPVVPGDTLALPTVVLQPLAP